MQKEVNTFVRQFFDLHAEKFKLVGMLTILLISSLSILAFKAIKFLLAAELDILGLEPSFIFLIRQFDTSNTTLTFL